MLERLGNKVYKNLIGQTFVKQIASFNIVIAKGLMCILTKCSINNIYCFDYGTALVYMCFKNHVRKTVYVGMSCYNFNSDSPYTK